MPQSSSICSAIWLLCALPVCLYLSVIACVLPVDASKHVVVIVLDDAGWNDFGFVGGDLASATPHMDQLISDGIKLEQHYAMPVCTPSRAALLTGRYPMRYGLQGDPLGPASLGGMSLDEVTLAQELKAAGYTTAAIGKWHIGYSAWEYTPTERGFDYAYNFLGSGGEDYWTKLSSMPSHTYQDLTNNRTVVTTSSELGLHNTLLFANKTAEAIRSLRTSSPNAPLFVYMGLPNPHEPLQPDQASVDACAANYTFGNAERKLFCGLMRMADNAVSTVTQVLTAEGLLNDTLLVVFSDNGATPKHGGSNYPLRGIKGTLFEGGVRTRAFVWGGSNVLPTARRGTAYTHMFHVTDWFPTLLEFAGRTRSSACNTRLPLDGVNHWSALLNGSTTTPPRDTMLLNAENNTIGGIRMGDYKLLLGQCTGPAGSVIAVPTTNTTPGTACPGSNNFLFDVTADPYESSNLYDNAAYSGVQANLTAAYNAFLSLAVSPISGRAVGDATSMASSRGGWSPWDSTGYPSSNTDCSTTPTTAPTPAPAPAPTPTPTPAATSESSRPRPTTTIVGLTLPVGVLIMLVGRI